MNEILELNQKISSDDIMGMFAHIKSQIPEGDVYTAFEKGVRFAESYYQVELNKRSSGFTHLFEIVKKNGINGYKIENVGEGKFKFTEE